MSYRFVKGHGTENDFVIVPADVDLTADRARALCDRRAGIGGDGVIRAARDEDGRWFMDYRNSDGSLSEMCGNGIRVLARYLREEEGAPFPLEIATRSGQIALRLTDGGGSLLLAPRTELTLSAIAAADLDSGSLYFDSEDDSPAAHFEVRTPFGVVRDVGTQFIAKLEGEHLEVGVRDGRVAIARDTETVEARPGDRVRIQETRPLSKLKRWRLVEVVERGEQLAPAAEAK